MNRLMNRREIELAIKKVWQNHKMSDGVEILLLLDLVQAYLDGRLTKKLRK